tara:strand:+ start:121 stop:306 length:186 start_codon:yes stop_codon:yes gene_type:complete
MVKISRLFTPGIFIYGVVEKQPLFALIGIFGMLGDYYYDKGMHERYSTLTEDIMTPPEVPK